MQVLPTTQLHLPPFERVAATLPTHGYLEESFGGLAYLKVDDNYIHQLFPLLEVPDVQKPDYFGPDAIGAHISVTYPQEGVIIDRSVLGQEYHFHITGLFTSELNGNRYYALQVKSPSLLALRQSHGLPDKLQFAQYWVDFHITIAIIRY